MSAVARVEVRSSVGGTWTIWVVLRTLAGESEICRSTHRTERAAWRAVPRAVAPYTWEATS